MSIVETYLKRNSISVDKKVPLGLWKDGIKIASLNALELWQADTPEHALKIIKSKILI